MTSQDLHCAPCGREKLHVLRSGAWYCCRCGTRAGHGVLEAPTGERQETEGAVEAGLGEVLPAGPEPPRKRRRRPQ